MEEWKEYKLGGITSKIGSGATPKGGKESYLGGNIALIRSQNILDFAFTNSGLVYINKDQASKLNNVEVKENDILLNITGDSVARVCIVPQKILPARVNQHVAIIRGNDIVDNRYLLYYLQYIKPYLLSLSQGGATRNALTKKMLEDLDIKVPSKNVQNIIISVLSSLDDKIELNRRINENLEQQAQALFKSWFVDFEPFKDGQFVDSELGMIPEGWRVGTLEEIGQIIGGGTPSKANSSFYCENGIPWITPKDLSINKSKYISRGENDITEIGYRNSSAKKIPAGSVLFSSRAPIGYIAIANNEVTTNQGFKSVIPTKAGTCFIYLFLQLYKKYIESLATGSTFKEASGALMKSLKLKIPPQSIFENFESMLNPLFSQQCVLESEIDHLSKLRDTLLPRLMSGKLEIKDNSYD